FVELHPDLVLHRATVASIAYLALNTTRPPFDDVEVRRAANFAINKAPIVELAYQGLASPADGPLPPTQWGYHEDLARYPFDPAAARAHLAAAAARGAFDPERVHRLFVPSTPRPYMPAPEEVARAIQANLAAVGIKTAMVVRSFSDHLAAVQRGEHDLCLLGWVGDTGDPDNFLYTLLSSDNAVPGSARNVAFLRDAELDRVLRAAQRAGSRVERERLYRLAQERVANEAPWVPLANAQVAVAARADVLGMVVNPSSHIYYAGVFRRGH